MPTDDARQVAREAVEKSKAAARARGLAPGAPKAPQAAAKRKSTGRDPAPVADVLSAVFEDRGWTAQVNVAAVMDRWSDVVGPQIAAHCEPVSFTDGELAVQASSSAWASNITLMRNALLAKFDEVLGAGVVTSLKVLPPSGRSWSRGRWSVKGRGPRDTYG